MRRSLRILFMSPLFAACSGEAPQTEGLPSVAEPTAGVVALEVGATTANGYTICSKREMSGVAAPPEFAGHAPFQKIEGYYFERLTGRLAASPELRNEVGFGRVTTCEQAASVSEVLRDKATASAALAGEGIAGLHDSPRADGADGAEEKIGGDHTAINSGSSVWIGFGNVANDFFTLDYPCSGSIIDDNVVMTAGHCAAPYEGDSTARAVVFVYSTATGWASISLDSDIQSEEPLRGPSAGQFIVHPDYAGGGAVEADDIALVILNGSLQDLTDSRVAYLWDESSSKKSSSSTFLGYGISQESNNLNEAMWRGAFDPNSWTSSWITAPYEASLTRGRICAGDSGGPLRHDSFNGRHVVAGVMSGVDDFQANTFCAADGKWQGWVGVDAKRSWISSTVPGGCTRLSTGGTNDWRLYDCWD